jgi:hypothetical protein
MRDTARAEEYRRWHRLQVTTQDVDPVYPVLWELGTTMECDDLAWLVLLHVAYYHLGSALRASELLPWDKAAEEPELEGELLSLPCATERRGHRGSGKLRRHLDSVIGEALRAGGPWRLLTNLPDHSETPWADLNERLMRITGNGRWAAYKSAEMAQKVLGLDIAVADAAHAHSSGPRKGLADVLGPVPLGNDPATIVLLDQVTSDLAGYLGESDIGYVETTLCDFHSLVDGHYYLGHDIDQMQDQLRTVDSGLTSDLTSLAFEAREACLPHEYLGELNGWTGVQKPRKSWYADKGIIAERS